MSQPPRPRPALPLARYALAGVYGLFCAVVGGSWFAAGKGAIIAGFPNSLAEATACLSGGIAVTLWALARLLRQRREPQATAREASCDGG